MTKIFKVPFADTGDKISPPDAIQPDGSVSYGLGYGFDYQRDTSLDSGGAPVDPLAKVFPREQHNGILNDITGAIAEAQINGLTIWQPSGSPYPINAMVRYSSKNWRSLVSNNTDTPLEGSSWTETSSRFVLLGGSTPIRLTAGSGSTAANIYAAIGPNSAGNLWTSTNFDPDQKITGENCRNAGLTAGGTQPYMQRLSDGVVIPLATNVYVDNGLLTKITGENCRNAGLTAGGTAPYMQRLSDGAVIHLATKTNASLDGIPTAPTAPVGTWNNQIASTAFVNESISARPSIGINQTWQDVTASRAKGVTYTNSTGRPIQIFINFDPDSGSSVLRIAGHPFNVNDNSSEFVSAIIPAGNTYSLSAWGTANTMKWLELR